MREDIRDSDLAALNKKINVDGPTGPSTADKFSRSLTPGRLPSTQDQRDQTDGMRSGVRGISLPLVQGKSDGKGWSFNNPVVGAVSSLFRREDVEDLVDRLIDEADGPTSLDIEQETLNNRAFRRVLHTGPNSQLVTMSLKPGEDIGKEVHKNTDQFIRIEQGTGEAELNGAKYKLKDGSAVLVPAGTEHNITNSNKGRMSIYTIYSPPKHKPGTVEKNKPVSEAVKIDNKHGLGAVPDNSNIDYMGFTVHMKPKDFLKLNPDRGRDPSGIRDAMKGGAAIGTPFLSAEWNEKGKHWKVYQHEGRGRMQVAHELHPDEEVPVHVFPRGEDRELRARHLTDEHLFAPIHSDTARGAAPFKFHPQRVTHNGKEKHREKPVSEIVDEMVG